MNNLFKNTNIKQTSARVELLKVFSDFKKPISYEDIKENLSMDKATFYRNISLFEEEGIINSFESNDKKRYFELKSNPHAHFICKLCNKIECIDTLHINIPDYKIDNVTISGICKKCL